MIRKFLNARVRPFYLLPVVMLAAGATYALLKGRTPERAADDFRPDRYIRPQSPITGFSTKKVREAATDLDPAELVLGVLLGKESRAYPINMLNHKPAAKVVNDTLGGRAIMATWCDSAHNAIVYSRDVDGKVLTFAVFGLLWKGSMVMHDQETMTQWSHILGEAKRGPLKGKRLEAIPSLITDWESWSRLYPEGTVLFLPKNDLEYTRKVYEDRDQYVLGIAGNGRSRAWSLADLDKKPVGNDFWQGQAVLVVFDAAHATARLYGRTVKGQVLTFAWAGKERHRGRSLQDRETGTTWEPVTGRAKAGPLAGQQLPCLPAMVSHQKIWNDFFPGSGE